MHHHQQQQHYTNSFLSTSSLHDLNAVDSRPSPMDPIGDPDPHPGSADHDSNDCMDDSFTTSLPLHAVGEEDDRSSLDNSSSSRTPYHLFSIDDVNPIESARARFLQIILDYFISDHVIQVGDSEPDYTAAAAPSREDKLSKRKSEEVQYGDPRLEGLKKRSNSSKKVEKQSISCEGPNTRSWCSRKQ